jgi:hypothetical protein
MNYLSKQDFNSALAYSYLPVAATQCAQPAAAFTMEASVGRGKASGVSLNKKKKKKPCLSVLKHVKLINTYGMKLKCFMVQHYSMLPGCDIALT